MKKPIKLKWFVSLVLLSLAIILVIGYSMLSAKYFILGMDNMIASNLEQTLSKYQLENPETQHQQSDTIDGYIISNSWQQQPQIIISVFKHKPKNYGVLYKIEKFDKNDEFKGVFFSMSLEQAGETLYISHHLTRTTLPNMVHQNIKRSLDSLIIISILSIISFAIIFWFIMRRVSQPIAALGQWTRDLTPDTLNQTIPDFSYSELNEQAELIRTSLSSVQDNLNREHQFLRHTSHELRTPISVIRSNIDLMHKLQDTHQIDPDPKQQQIFDRIDRASLTMKNLTETLLWLSRDEDENLPKRTVQLDKLVEQLVEDTRYLLKNKVVEIELKTEPCSLELPEVASRIVLGNIIRNAFQHTPQGKVIIVQQGNRVKINNIQTDGIKANDRDDLGFGLGLHLTAQLTKRLNWDYTNTSHTDGHGASITLGSM